MDSTLRLFRAVPIRTKKRKRITKAIIEKTIRMGCVFSPEVVANYSEHELDKLIDSINVSLTPEQMNNSFHKSWQKVRDASIEQLVFEQLVHYFTTYGFEALGIYDENSVYVPNEELDIPKLDIDKLNVIIIQGYTKEELKAKLLNLLQSGIALHEDTIDDVIDVATFVELDEKDIDSIRNVEVKTIMYDYLNIIPERPIEFLRHIVYKATNKTLLIKNAETIEEIKGRQNLDILGLFKKYKNAYGLERLAEIFYRFKPIFLAFRTNSGLKSITNKIRKLAEEYHKPMKIDYLNQVTARIKKGEILKVKELKDELDKVNIFRKIRLAYALNFRLQDNDSILYRVRNGKGYATRFYFYNKKEARRILKIVIDSIVEDMNVKGKKIYIPDYMTYALPATEKQFTGYYPAGSYVSIPKDMVFGIHWEDVENNRIDLDLSLINPDTGKIGWDADYRTEGRDILFSGDMTSAPKPKGASELFYVKRQTPLESILIVNYFNYDKEVEVPFKIIVAHERITKLGMNHMVNPNNVISVAQTKINQKEKILGLLVTTGDECRFYFAETNIGKSITSSQNEFVENSRKYLFNFYTNTITLNEILEKAGAKLVKNKEKCDVDLSPENLGKDSILNIILG